MRFSIEIVPRLKSLMQIIAYWRVALRNMNTTFERWIVDLRARTSCDSQYKWSLLYQFHSLSEGLTNIPPVCQSLITKWAAQKCRSAQSRFLTCDFYGMTRGSLIMRRRNFWSFHNQRKLANFEFFIFFFIYFFFVNWSHFPSLLFLVSISFVFVSAREKLFHLKTIMQSILIFKANKTLSPTADRSFHFILSSAERI